MTTQNAKIKFLVAYFTEGGRLGTVSKYGLFYLLSFPGVYSFKERLREGLVLLSKVFRIISLQRTRTLSGKVQAHEIGGHQTEDQNQIRTSSS